MDFSIVDNGLKFDKVIFSEQQIKDRIAEVGKQITQDYKDKQEEGIIVVSILKGAAIFMADLARALDLVVSVDFMCISSYEDSLKSSGKLNVKLDTDHDLKGKHVIIAEDIVDTGLTLEYVTKHLKERGAASVAVCAFLNKHVYTTDIDVAYTCFDCPPDFMVGYGLDYKQRFRNIPYVTALTSTKE